jgi:hypothetical protein
MMAMGVWMGVVMLRRSEWKSERWHPWRHKSYLWNIARGSILLLSSSRLHS